MSEKITALPVVTTIGATDVFEVESKLSAAFISSQITAANFIAAIFGYGGTNQVVAKFDDGAILLGNASAPGAGLATFSDGKMTVDGSGNILTQGTLGIAGDFTLATGEWNLNVDGSGQWAVGAGTFGADGSLSWFGGYGYLTQNSATDGPAIVMGISQISFDPSDGTGTLNIICDDGLGNGTINLDSATEMQVNGVSTVSTSITTAGLVGKTMIFSHGLLTGFL